MKKLLLMLFILAICLMTLTTCVTLNQENYAEGVFFREIYLDHYDSSIPIEEHSYVVCLAPISDSRGTSLIMVNGEKARKTRGTIGSTATSVHMNDIIILPPGEHTLTFLHDSLKSLGAVFKTYWNVKKDLTVNLQSGHYYFFPKAEETENGIEFIFDDFENHSEVLVYGSTNISTMVMPVNAIIEGINAKIATKFQGFTGGKRVSEQ